MLHILRETSALPHCAHAFPSNGFCSPFRFLNHLVIVAVIDGPVLTNMRRAVQRYREVINTGERSEYVRKAEDISDHLRLLLAAG